MTRPSPKRLRANLDLYSRWRFDRGTNGVLYVWRSRDIVQHIWASVREKLPDDAVIFRQLDAIVERAATDCEERRQARRAGATAELSADGHGSG